MTPRAAASLSVLLSVCAARSSDFELRLDPRVVLRQACEEVARLARRFVPHALHPTPACTARRLGFCRPEPCPGRRMPILQREHTAGLAIAGRRGSGRGPRTAAAAASLAAQAAATRESRPAPRRAVPVALASALRQRSRGNSDGDRPKGPVQGTCGRGRGCRVRHGRLPAAAGAVARRGAQARRREGVHHRLQLLLVRLRDGRARRQGQARQPRGRSGARRQRGRAVREGHGDAGDAREPAARAFPEVPRARLRPLGRDRLGRGARQARAQDQVRRATRTGSRRRRTASRSSRSTAPTRSRSSAAPRARTRSATSGPRPRGSTAPASWSTRRACDTAPRSPVWGPPSAGAR